MPSSGEVHSLHYEQLSDVSQRGMKLYSVLAEKKKKKKTFLIATEENYILK